MVRIDLHAHYVGRDLIEAAKAQPAHYGIQFEIDGAGEHVRFPDGALVRPFFHDLWDLDSRLSKMDASGVDVQVISTWTDIFADRLLPDAEAAAWSRLQNESLAAAARQHPRRFMAMGVLPMQSAPLALVELEYCQAELGMRAFEIGTSIGGLNLDEPDLDPIWGQLERDGPLVLLHPPRTTAAAPRLGRYFLNNIIGNLLETVLAASSLIFGGVLDRHPGLRIVLPHAGGYFPYQVGRLDHGFAVKPECQHLPQPPSDYMRFFWYDTLAFRPQILQVLSELVGLDRIVFGTDYPFDMCDRNAVKTVESAFPNENLDALWGTTAQLLLTK